MTNAPENIVLVYLRRVDAKLDRLVDDVQNLKVRMTHVEEGLAGVNRRLDGVERRMDRIERRLDIRDDALMEAAEPFKRPDS